MVRVLASSMKCYVFNIRFGLNKDCNRDIQVSAYYSFSPTRSISGAQKVSLYTRGSVTDKQVKISTYPLV
jgi:hypothetical protein